MLRLGLKMLAPSTKLMVPFLISILLNGSDATKRSTVTAPVTEGAAPVPPAWRLMLIWPRARLLWIRIGSSVLIAISNFQSLNGGVSIATLGGAPEGGCGGGRPGRFSGRMSISL